MTIKNLGQCQTVKEFTRFLSSLDATVGRLGGRHFVTYDEKQSYSMNQIVLQFKKIVGKTKASRLEIFNGCESIRSLEEAELFKALFDSDDKTLSKIQKNLTTIRRAVGNFVFSLTHKGFDRKAVLLSLTLGHSGERIYTDKNRLVIGKELLEASHFAWLLNLGLLKMAEERATSEAEKKQIRFLAANFLNKSAPIQVPCWKAFFKKISPKFEKMFDTMYQVGPFDEYWYHRESLRTKIDFGKEFNKKLAFGTSTPFVLTDSVECKHLFPLKFSPLDDNPFSTAFERVMKKGLKEHLAIDREKAFKRPLNRPFLIDVTDSLGGQIQIEGYPENKEVFDRNFELLKTSIDQAVNRVVRDLVRETPSLAGREKEIRQLIKDNVTGVCRIDSEEAKGIKLIPLHPDSKKEFFQERLIDFIHETGLYLGAMSLRREVLDAFGRRRDVHYIVSPESRADTLYYPTKEAFTGTRVFQRLTALFDRASVSAASRPVAIDAKTLGVSVDTFEVRVKALSEKPHITVLGKATMNLLEGLIDQIAPEKWKEINENPAIGSIFQASLMMIREHLATAEMKAVAGAFNQFAQEIELVHAEMATLLELTRPYREEDFAEIYSERLSRGIPLDLKPFLKVGLGKTALNTFAGINAAVMQLNPVPQRVYGQNVYFEEVSLVGENHGFEKLRKEIPNRKIDLYVGQFNPNINIDPGLTDYKVDDITAQVRYLLASGKAAEHMTIAVDCTIDKSPSARVNALLESFKKEIQEGKLNFVFFNSGQKFDMLGMDNYYGSPFYMVNNGDKMWKPFDSLLTHEVHRTDALSTQWFCLSNQYAFDSLQKYKELIFKNTRYILDHMPRALLPSGDLSQPIKVNRADNDMDVCFIDIKVRGENRVNKSYKLMEAFYEKMVDAHVKTFSRQSFGFYHPCYLVFDLPEGIPAATTRLTPGLNPDDSEAIISFFNSIAI